MTLLHSARAGIYGSVALTPPAPLGPFTAPGTPAPGQAALLATVTSNTITTTVGDRVVLLFSHTRGSTTSATSSLRSLSSIVGTGDFLGLSFDLATEVIASQSQTLDANVSGARATIASLIVPTGFAGTGAFTVTWSGIAWSTLAQAFALPPSSLVASLNGGAADATVSIALATAEVLEANDLIFSVCALLEDDAFTVPSGFTEAANYSNNNNNRAKTAWKNGTLTSPFTWAALSAVAPAAAAGAIFRRSVI